MKVPIGIEKRLFRKRRIEGDCWLWEGYKTWNGYGLIGYQGKLILVHHASAMLYLGYKLGSHPIVQVNHKKICPNRHCFNPEHLYLGDQAQNLQDAYQMGKRDQSLAVRRGHETRNNAGSEDQNQGERKLD